jgi:hypothetical protein
MEYVSVRKGLPLALALPLFLLACSQVGYETYGCACASRTYSTTEIAEYRRDAAEGDQKAIAEMQEYHMWRKEPAQEMSYFIRRFPALSEENADDLLFSALFIAKKKAIPIERRRAMLGQFRSAMARLEKRPKILWGSKFDDYFRDDNIPVMTRLEDLDALRVLDELIGQFDAEIAARG